ncbi:MAG: hypothetical protein Q9220_005014 [cf. Caloplaca sp. 1 TL-2023]
MADKADYSDLEVGSKSQEPDKGYSTLQVGSEERDGHSTLQVGGPRRRQEEYSMLQTSRPPPALYDSYKVPTLPYEESPDSASSAPERNEATDAKAPPPPSHPTICGLRRRTFWIIAAVAFVVIAAVIGGAIGGTLSKNNSHSSKPSTGNAPPDNSPPVLAADKLLENTALSTVAWNNTQGILQQRVYLQAIDNKIWELSWNASTKHWFASNEAVAQARSGSPLAAAVAYDGPSPQINLYYLNTDGELILTNTTDYTTWDNNPVMSSNGTNAKPANDSSLTAIWYKSTQCVDCPYNAFIAYQDSVSGKFSLVNSSTTGRVEYTTIPGNPAPGSGSSLNFRWRSPALVTLRMNYQLNSGQIASTTWDYTTGAWQAFESASDTSAFVSTALGAPMAQFNWGRGAPAKLPDYLFILSAGSSGVAVNWWDNSDPKNTQWESPQTPEMMQRVKALSPLAANAAGHVFAVEGGVVKEFEKGLGDGTTWTLVGDVTRS